jgi:hypothetical protein
MDLLRRDYDCEYQRCLFPILWAAPRDDLELSLTNVLETRSATESCRESLRCFQCRRSWRSTRTGPARPSACRCGGGHLLLGGPAALVHRRAIVFTVSNVSFTLYTSYTPRRRVSRVLQHTTVADHYICSLLANSHKLLS